jgi:hypothetical protein
LVRGVDEAMKNKNTYNSMFTEALTGAATDLAKEMGYKTATSKGVIHSIRKENIVSKMIAFIRLKKGNSAKLVKSGR